MFAQYNEMFSRWGQKKGNRDDHARAQTAPGSPTKSPQKGETTFRSSSPGQKEELLALSQAFWSINARGMRAFQSGGLQGRDGEVAVRSLLVRS